MEELAVPKVFLFRLFFEFKSIEEVFEILDCFYWFFNWEAVRIPTPLLFLLKGIGG